MDIETVRSKRIDSWIKDHPEMKVEELMAPIQLYGKIVYYPVWRIPLKFLIYNIRNGRFAAELLSKEAELKRSLDPTVMADAKIIQELLLAQNPRESLELEASLKEYTQLDEGIITFDGAVINANRRMAVLSKLYEETGDSKFECLKVARLPKNVDQKDMWRIEAGLQFAKDLRLEYGPVNELLKLREGTKQGLTPKQISRALMGRYSPDDVEKRLRILELIDSYLDYIGQSGKYQLIQEERNVEKFNSLNNNVLVPLAKKSEIPKTEIPGIIEAGFSLIKSEEVTHWDIRKLRRIAGNDQARKTLMNGFKAKALKKPELESLVARFKIAREISDAALERDRPIELAEKALANLDGIDRDSTKLKEPEFQQLLKKIATILAELRTKP